MDERIRELERRAKTGDQAAAARLGRMRVLAGVREAKEHDPAKRARERGEEDERRRSAEAVEFCRRAVNEGITANLYRPLNGRDGGRNGECWCAVFMSLRRLEALNEFDPKETAWRDSRWSVHDAEFRGRDFR